jgi:hypothetical protein
MGQIGLLAGFGSEVPGTASNLGTRVGGGPRWSFSARVGAARTRLPLISDPTGAAEQSFVTTAVHTGVTLGLFDGFRLMPTVGGFLSTDVFGQASFLMLPEGEGFSGGTKSFALGVRVGILREGFTLPGISVSAAKRFPGSVTFGDTAGGDIANMVLEPSVTSLRATVGKDLFAVEVLAGVGWEEYTGDVALRASDGLVGFVDLTGDMSGSRRLYFGSAAMTFSIVLSLSVEGGWAEGFDPVAGYSGGHDPAAGAPFGSFAVRLAF